MQLIIVVLLLSIAIIVASGVVFMSYWPIYGAPYVPTKNQEILQIFNKIHLKKGQIFCDLGCGDGRLVMAANKITKTVTYGVDINWGLILWCKFWSNKQTMFMCKNILYDQLPLANIYYLYLWPNMLNKIINILRKAKVKATVISKAFKIKGRKFDFSFEIGDRPYYGYIIEGNK